MGGQTAGNEKHICTGLFAHVDAGKTTLSEAMLYQSGALRRLGRVDHQDAFFIWMASMAPRVETWHMCRRVW